MIKLLVTFLLLFYQEKITFKVLYFKDPNMTFAYDMTEANVFLSITRDRISAYTEEDFNRIPILGFEIVENNILVLTETNKIIIFEYQGDGIYFVDMGNSFMILKRI